MDPDSAQDGRWHATPGAGKLGLAGVAGFVGCASFMHLAQPDLSPLHDAVSYYMNGRLGWVPGVGLGMMGLGSFGWLAAAALSMPAGRGRERVPQPPTGTGLPGRGSHSRAGRIA